MAFPAFLLLASLAAPLIAQDAAADSKPVDLTIAAAPYAPRQEAKGEVKIVGASNLAPLVGLWREGFAKYHPAAKLAIELEGTETAAPILTKEKQVIAILSRLYTPEEVQKIEKESGEGAKIHQFVIAYDILGVIVNKANPITGITRAQARQLLRKGTDKEKEAAVWGDIGVEGDFAKVKIAPHGREKTSGTRTYVRRLVLSPEEEEREQQSHTSSSSIADAVEKEPGAVGYASLTHIRRDKVKVLGVALEAGQPFIEPTDENVAAGKYPLVRPLVLVAKGTEKGLEDPTLVESIAFMLSQRGQLQVLKDGFLPATRSDIVHGLDLLGHSAVK